MGGKGLRPSARRFTGQLVGVDARAKACAQMVKARRNFGDLRSVSRASDAARARRMTASSPQPDSSTSLIRAFQGFQVKTSLVESTIRPQIAHNDGKSSYYQIATERSYLNRQLNPALAKIVPRKQTSSVIFRLRPSRNLAVDAYTAFVILFADFILVDLEEVTHW